MCSTRRNPSFFMKTGFSGFSGGQISPLPKPSSDPAPRALVSHRVDGVDGELALKVGVDGVLSQLPLQVLRIPQTETDRHTHTHQHFSLSSPSTRMHTQYTSPAKTVNSKSEAAPAFCPHFILKISVPAGFVSYRQVRYSLTGSSVFSY